MKTSIVSTKLAVFVVFSLFSLMVIPAYANVTSVSLEKSVYTENEDFVFTGKIKSADRQIVSVIIYDSNGVYQGMVSDLLSNTDGTFSTIPRAVDKFFDSKDTYYATAFTDKQENGMTIKLEYDGDKVFLVPDFVLALKSISDKTIEVEKTISFTASLTDSSVEDVVFSLDNEPSGATIDSSSGKFVWTPTKAHGNIQDIFYNFDIIVNKGAQEDRENITITVKQAYVEPEKKPEPVKKPEPKTTEPKEIGLASFVDESKDPQSYVDRYDTEASYKEWFDDNYPEYSSIYEAVGLEKPIVIPASFVDESKDPQSYVDRYDTEASYKEWFDDNYPEYSSIYEAVGLEKPIVIPAFVDPNQDPQYYVDRYNTEASYKEWFDDNYPDITIYQAVGLEEPEEVVAPEPKIGECGTGTILVEGICTPEKAEGGGCLIATATYGSEMTPQVQFLREIRDNQLMSTDSGISFMTGFNQFYYSFSPYIADYERENPAFKEAVKIGLTPLLSSLSIMSYAESESEVVGYGIGVILANIGMYFVAPAIVILKTRKYIKI